MIGDLHIHTTYSDGSQTPLEALAAAASRGLDYVSFVDHDTTAGAAEAVSIGMRLGVSVIPGVEISAWDPLRERKIHILGYNYRLPARSIDELVTPIREARTANTLRQIAKVRDAGYEITEADVRAFAPEGCLYKQHIMLALINAGYTDAIYSDLYRALFKGDGPAAHDIHYVPAIDAVRAIKADGGYAVLAHPGQLASYDAVPELVAAGLDGIELFHEDHSASDHERARGLAREHGLILTGGSDAHGTYGSALDVGDLCAPAGAWEALTRPHDPDVAWAVDLVRRAGRYAREAVAEEADVSLKGGDIKDLVTKHDVTVDRMLTTAIRERFPDHGFVTEEHDHPELRPGQPVWIIDPIDGTTNFVAARKDFAVSVALYDGDLPRFGVVYDVMADDLYVGVRGAGATLNGMPLGPVWGGIPKAPRECVFECSLNAADHFEERGETSLRRLATTFRATRSNGSAAIGICRVARDTLDVYCSSSLAVWDYAAAAIVLAEAGGDSAVIGPPEDMDGGFLHSGRRTFIGAGHPETLATVRQIVFGT